MSDTEPGHTGCGGGEVGTGKKACAEQRGVLMMHERLVRGNGARLYRIYSIGGSYGDDHLSTATVEVQRRTEGVIKWPGPRQRADGSVSRDGTGRQKA